MQKIFSAVTRQIQALTNPTVTERYKFESTIGKGKFSQVKRATDRNSGQEVAVKILSLPTLQQKEILQARREIEIMKLISHPHCIQLLDVYNTASHIYIVMELMTGGELFDRIISKEHYSETEAARCFVQIISAIEYLHANGIVHRDLKPENVLYLTPDEDSPVKLADFGFGKVVKQEGDVLSTMCGTPSFVAPEIIARKVRAGSSETYSKSCDIWSAGVVLYCMLSGEHPFDQDANLTKLFGQISSGSYSFRPELWEEVSDEAVDLVKAMMTVDPARRLTATECLRHPWCERFRDGQTSSKRLTHAQLKLKENAEATAKRKLLGFLRSSPGLPQAGGGAMHVGCILAKGEELEVMSLNMYGKELLACPEDPDPSPKFVYELLDPTFTITHSSFLAKAMRDKSLPNSIQHPLRNVMMWRKDGSSVQVELLVGKLDDKQSFDGETVFFGYFVPTEHSVGGHGLSLRQKMENQYGIERTRALLDGEADPLPESYDDATVCCFSLPPDLLSPPAGEGEEGAAAGAGERRRVLDELVSRYRLQMVRCDATLCMCVAGTNHVGHDLAFDQASRAVNFAAELVFSLAHLAAPAAGRPGGAAEARVAVGIATGSVTVALGLAPGGHVAAVSASGEAAAAAQRMRESGRPGFLHLSQASAERLCEERGLFMDFSVLESMSVGSSSPPSPMLAVAGGAGPGPGPGSAAAALAAAAAAGVLMGSPGSSFSSAAAAFGGGGGGSSAARRRSLSMTPSADASVWIDCFGAAGGDADSSAPPSAPGSGKGSPNPGPRPGPQDPPQDTPNEP